VLYFFLNIAYYSIISKQVWFALKKNEETHVFDLCSKTNSFFPSIITTTHIRKF